MRTLGNITVLDTLDVRKLLRIGKEKCLDLFHAHDFPSIQIGKNLYVQENALNEYLSSKKIVQ